MPPQTTPAGLYVQELLEKFPDAPALTLAKKAYKECPQLWSSLEACRGMVRHYLGVRGKVGRKYLRDRSRMRSPRQAGWHQTLPDAKDHFDEPWGAVQFDGPLRALVLSDIHVPYHDKAAVKLAIEYGVKHKADFILLNGDILDNFAVSMWEKDPRKRDFAGEVESGKQLLETLGKAFPNAKTVWKEGNHEFRYRKFLMLKAPELLDIPNFQWEEIFSLDTHGIQYVKDKRPIRLGKLNVLHGHEHARGISAPVNPARGLFLRGHANTMAGHWHQTSQHSENTLEQDVISTWSTGCLCDMAPEYMPLNKWSQGFAFVAVDKGGAFEVNNLRIIDGKVY